MINLNDTTKIGTFYYEHCDFAPEFGMIESAFKVQGQKISVIASCNGNSVEGEIENSPRLNKTDYLDIEGEIKILPTFGNGVTLQYNVTDYNLKLWSLYQELSYLLYCVYYNYNSEIIEDELA